MRKILEFVFNTFTLAVLDLLAAGWCADDFMRAPNALDLILGLVFVGLGLHWIRTMRNDARSEGRIDGTINTWEIVHRLRANEQHTFSSAK